MITLVCLISFISGYLIGGWHEKISWVHYDRFIGDDGCAYEWDKKNRKWVKI